MRRPRRAGRRPARRLRAGGHDRPERGVTLNDIQESENFFGGDYLGRQVTVSATVTEVLGPRSLDFDGADNGGDCPPVQTPEPVVVEEA